MAEPLDRLFAPASVAIVGATESPGKPGRRVTENLLGTGARLYPVHPSREQVLGLRAYRNLTELPERPDLAVLAVAAASAVEATEEAVRAGVPYVIVLAGGFGETGDHGRALEGRLVAAVSGSGTRLLGPNTLGIQVPGGVDTVFVDHEEGFTPGGVVMISQSGSVAVEALAAGARHGFPLRCFVGPGNAVDLGTVEFIRHFAEDPHTRCICVYLEHLGEGRDLLEAARRASRRMPVFFLKAGRTQAGAAAVASHTGRLAGSDRVVDGAFVQYGIQRVDDDDALMDAARLAAFVKPARGSRVAVVTPAGGYGVMCVDSIQGPLGAGVLELATLAPATEQKLRAVCLPFASLRNPIDLTAGVTTDSFAHAVDAVLDDPGVDIAIVLAFFAPDGIEPELVDRIAASAHASDRSVIVLCRFGARTDEFCRAFTAAGLAAYASLPRAVRAARLLVERARIVADHERTQR